MARNYIRFLGVFCLFCGLSMSTARAQDLRASTYCNPINIDYTYMVYNAYNNLSYRSGADPAVVEFRGAYYMFVTRSMGYWYSTDLLNWEFIAPSKWYFQGSNAPAAYNYKDSVLFMAGDPSGSMSMLYTDDPKSGEWQAVPAILNGLQDPAFYIGDDGDSYLYWGSSNTYPIRGRALDMSKKFKPSDEVVELFNLNPEKHGWERFGENHSDTVLAGYIEGPWMTEHNGKYYLQYAAPGTEFNVYGDGAYISDHPLGPFEYMPNNPFSYKPGGFINGAGHGSTVDGPGDHFWHFSSMAVAINIGWERRIGMFPTFFDEDGLMYSNMAFGDYPHYAPAVKDKMGAFTGWMLLSYHKPVKVSSQQDAFGAANLVDEHIKSFWVAENNNEGQWVEIDLQEESTVYAVQINYNDYKSDLYGRVPGLYQRYVVEYSLDGKKWSMLIDKSKNFEDVPNDYVELDHPARARYIRYTNIHVPTPQLSLSDIRIFGKGSGKAPGKVKGFSVDRKADKRAVELKWQKQEQAQGYNVYWGIAPDKLYNSWMVYDDAALELKSLNTDQEYYFAVEAFNENGVSAQTKVMKAE